MKNSILSAFACLCFIFSANAQYTWTQKASMSLLRYGASSFTIGNYGYVGTGYNDSSSPMSDWWRFDPSTNTWSQMASMTGPRSAAVAFSINGMGYCGLGLSSAGHLTDFHEYNPGTNSWATKASLPAQGRYGCSSFAIGNTGYVSCGNLGSASGPFSNQVFGYDATTNTWSAKAAFPGMARYGGRGATINNKGYAFGGINGTGTSSSNFFNDLWEYDAVSNSWLQRMGISGNGRQYPSVFTLDNKLICGNGIHWTGYFETFEAYDPANNSWSPVPSLPVGEARWAAASFSIGNSGFIATGNKSFNNPTVVVNDVWELTLATSLNENPANSGIELNVFSGMHSGSIHVNVDAPLQMNYTFLIYNMNGQVVAERKISNGESIIHADLSSGLFFATLTTAAGEPLATRKFWVSK